MKFQTPQIKFSTVEASVSLTMIRRTLFLKITEEKTFVKFEKSEDKAKRFKAEKAAIKKHNKETGECLEWEETTLTITKFTETLTGDLDPEVNAFKNGNLICVLKDQTLTKYRVIDSHDTEEKKNLFDSILEILEHKSISHEVEIEVPQNYKMEKFIPYTEEKQFTRGKNRAINRKYQSGATSRAYQSEINGWIETKDNIIERGEEYKFLNK